MKYPDVEPQANFPQLERMVIDTWERDRTFERSVQRRADADEFVFYDGPPFANGLPHYGHLLTGFVKDVVPRYKTMQGYRVERRFGWDCHGLPIEMEAEQRIGVSGRAAVTAYGVDKFNEYCRSLVGTTAQTWQDYVTRQARWVDMVNDYKTMDLAYMESVMWALKRLWTQGLLYEGYRVLPYCWECETPLSNFETRLDNAYRDRQDPALTVWFELEPASGADRSAASGADRSAASGADRSAASGADRSGSERLLVWTTTPWTLPSNLAIAVGADIDYAMFEEGGQRYLLGEATLDRYERHLGGATRVGTLKGAELEGRRYRPLFDYFADTPNAFRVLTADFVSTDDGTAAVHMAPGFGEDDQRACEAAGIPVVVPVDDRGRFTSEVPDYEGQQVFDANTAIVRDLKQKGVVVSHDSYVHSYPHCWRTDTPLIYRAMSSWFVQVTAVKERMQELNQQITWVPEHVRDGSFGKWLEGARDWSISRNRFWGSPIPVWKSDDPSYPRIDVYGSLDELEHDFGVRPDDLHRPGIDELVRPNPDDPTGQSTMRRVEDVLDCWFESGAMPFAQVHYPFENREWFESHFPGNFIVEYIGQTRGWFYTLHVLATALFDKPAFETCLVHGVLLGDDGQKLSKRLKNYPDPVEVFDTLGSDAMRWALLSSAVLRGGDMVTDRRSMAEAVRQVLLPIWNAWHFLALYANAAGLHGSLHGPSPSAHVLDRYATAKARQLVEELTARMDTYDLAGACGLVVAYLDSLNNWYIRRSRQRFWDGDQDAVDTLHTVLVTLCQAAAPLLPLLTDTVYRGLTDNDSVHLTDWPDVSGLPLDRELVADMDLVREVCSAAAAIRTDNGLRVRLPLASLTVALPDAERLRSFVDLVADEVNVKDVKFGDVADLGQERVEVDLRVVGPQLGPDTPKVLAAMREGNYSFDAEAGRLRVLDHEFGAEQFTRRLVPHDTASTAVLPGGRGLVRLDLEVTPELEAEGLVRDIVRLVNEVRRQDGLHVSDRIHLVIDPHHHDDARAALEAHRQFVMNETLAVELHLADDDRPLADGHRVHVSDGRAIQVAVRPVPTAEG